MLLFYLIANLALCDIHKNSNVPLLSCNCANHQHQCILIQMLVLSNAAGINPMCVTTNININKKKLSAVISLEHFSTSIKRDIKRRQIF